MILVTGAAGKTGRAVISALAKSGEPIRALARRSDQAARLEALGADNVLIGDLLYPDGVARAAQGVRAIYHIAPNVSPDETAMGKIIVDAARAAGVDRFIFHSVLYPQIEAMPHHWQKLRVEELLLASGLCFTILQPAVYMQNILAQWEQIRNNGIYSVPYSPETRLSMVDLEDVAEAAAIALTQPGHENEIIELVGTSAISQGEVAEVLTKQLGRTVSVKKIPTATWQQNAQKSGLGDYQTLTLRKMFCYYESYGFAGNTNALRALLQRKPTSFADFVKRIKSE